MGFTVPEIEEAISKQEENFDGGGYGGNIYENIKYGEDVEVEGLPKIELVEEFGGEGQGDDYWVVFKVGDQFFKKNGWYASYDGGELDGDLHEVFPTEVTRTEYTTKKPQ